MHRPGPFDWLARVVMLVLAAMVSLSIIGAIAAIPSGVIEGRMGIPSTEQAMPDAPPEQPDARPSGQANTTDVSPAAPGSTDKVAAMAPPEPDPGRWLEAITYALLALVGLTALGVLLLWRGLRERRRIADALEMLAARDRL